MAKPKYDGVIEAVHYGDDGQIAWVRAYLRRGPTWSDLVLLDRRKLIELIKGGKRFVIGKRVPYLASTFETFEEVALFNQGERELLVTDHLETNRDNLKGAPIL